MESLKGFEWITHSIDDHLIAKYMQGLGISEILARILISRSIAYEDVTNFLTPSLKQFLPEPTLLLDMQKAVEHTVSAIKNKENIVIYGDYDVDGATASALLRRYFHDVGIPTDLYIPDRLNEGYGANTDALINLAKSYSLCLMVDCGTTAFEPLENARKADLDVIVLDHHTAESTLPKACAVINPNRQDQNLKDRDDLKYLCAAGVSFLFIVALNRALRNNGFFTTIQEPNLLQYLDLVALGTVCDVMPLKGLNRAFVTQGLKIAKKQGNIGLTTLANITNLNQGIDSAYHFGFIIGPRINAGGRVGKADYGSKLLFTNNASEAQELAQHLQAYNLERQEIEQHVLQEAILQVEKNSLTDRSVIMVKGDGWHPGVIGIVASRLKDHFHKPALVVSLWNGEEKGSGRSVSGLDLGSLMLQAVQQNLLSKGGGHAMAAGFSIQEQQYDAFYDFLDNIAKPILKDRKQTLRIDGILSLNSINLDLIDQLSQLEPYGSGHPSPTIALQNVRLAFCDIVGTQHIRMHLQDELGNTLKAISFRSLNTPLSKLLKHKGSLEVAGSLKRDSFQGKEQIQLIVEDAKI